jgi:hypothetical protein
MMHHPFFLAIETMSESQSESERGIAVAIDVVWQLRGWTSAAPGKRHLIGTEVIVTEIGAATGIVNARRRLFRSP